MANTMQSGALAPTVAAPTPSRDGRGSSSAPEDALPAGELLGGRYEILALVGRGGQGDVYRARDREVPGHVVALKLMHHAARSDEERAFAMRELRMLATVNHPAIVQFKDFGWYGARLFVVFPWLEGNTLEQVGRIGRAQARRIFERIAGGLAALHAKGVRHQDIKPSNIFLARVDGIEDPMPMLLDLGVAARDDDAPVAGSPDYFAPEVAAAWPHRGEVGPAADVYALALTLRNALDPDTAPRLDPFSKQDLERRANEPVPPPHGSDLRHLAGAFARWLAIDPAQRPSAEALRRELAILTAPEDRRRERARMLRRIAPWLGLLALGVGLASYWALRELEARDKAAAVAEAEQRQAERAASAARRDADAARRAAQQAHARATASAEQAARLEQEAQQALQRVREAQRALGRSEDDRARLETAMSALQTALEAAERARAVERSEAERRLSAVREELEARIRAASEQRDRAFVLAGEAEARAREAETRAQQAETRAQQAETRAQQAETRAQQAETRAAAAEASARTAEQRREQAEARARELAERLAAVEAGTDRTQAAAEGETQDPASGAASGP